MTCSKQVNCWLQQFTFVHFCEAFWTMMTKKPLKSRTSAASLSTRARVGWGFNSFLCSMTFEYYHFLLLNLFTFFSYQLTNAVENLAHVLHCAAQSNLTMSEATTMRLMIHLTKRLSLLIQELSTEVSILISLVFISSEICCDSFLVIICKIFKWYVLNLALGFNPSVAHADWKLLHACLWRCFICPASLFCLFSRASPRWCRTFSRSLVTWTLRPWQSNTWTIQTSSSCGSRSNWCPCYLTYPQISSPASAPRTSPAPFTKPCEFPAVAESVYLHANNSVCRSSVLFFLCPAVCSVEALSEYMGVMDAGPVYSRSIYDNFIYSFLLQHSTSGK